LRLLPFLSQYPGVPECFLPLLIVVPSFQIQHFLRHIGEKEAAQRLERAVATVIKEGKQVTYDLGGTAGTRETGQAIINKL